MKYKIWLLLFIFLVSIAIIGCSNKEEEEFTSLSEELGVAEQSDAKVSDEDGENASFGDVVACGEVYTQGDMSYGVIGVRIEEVEGVNQLILKVEAYNNSDQHFDFNPLMNVELTDSKGNEASFELMSPAYKEDVLDGVVLGGGNKRMGEIVFDISQTKSDEFIFKLGNMMEKKDAIKISKNDIDKVYQELFQNSGVAGEYSIGDTIEFEDVSISFDGVKTQPKNTYNSNYDEEGMGLMVLEMTMENNSGQAIEFVSVSSASTIREVCTADGRQLDYEDYSYQNRNWVEDGETKSETFGLYYDESVKDFYLLLSPDLLNRTSVKVVTFSIE